MFDCLALRPINPKRIIKYSTTKRGYFPLIKTYRETITYCTNCGKETPWDFSLGEKPLCANCWDTKCEKEEENIPKDTVWWGAENEKTAKEIKALEACRKFREAHIDRWKGKNGYWQKWNESHREERIKIQQKYTISHKEEIRKAQHRRYLLRKQKRNALVVLNTNKEGVNL